MTHPHPLIKKKKSRYSLVTFSSPETKLATLCAKKNNNLSTTCSKHMNVERQKPLPNPFLLVTDSLMSVCN